MNDPTDAQMEVVRAMLWRGDSLPMTDSEITARTNRIARYPVARGSVVDRLNALAKKGLVETVDEGPPRRRRLTAAGIARGAA
jgi:DNA-binding PadR family transcriptional regulator